MAEKSGNNRQKKGISRAIEPRRLIVRGGEIGLMRGSTFVQYTNFGIKPMYAVSTPEDVLPPRYGFVFRVSCSSGVEKDCFVCNHDIQNLRSFVKAAGKVQMQLYYAKVNDDLWSLYVLDLLNEVTKGPGMAQKTIVTCVGRQPNSTTWVLSPEVHIDKFGQLIPLEQQEYYWCLDYIPQGLREPLQPVKIQVPLVQDHTCLNEFLALQKDSFNNNFLSSFMALSGTLVLFHFEKLREIQDECPIILCYSKESGTGKSTTLKNIMSIYGAKEEVLSPTSSSSSIVGRSAYTSIPIALDDLQSSLKMEELAVEFFNGFSKTTLSGGTTRPKTGLVITANETFANNQRKVQRIIHIPFFKAECVISEAEHIQIDDKLVQTRASLSSCIGYLISLREALTSPISRNFIGENLMPFISQHMPSVHYRLKKCYALILASARLLCAVVANVVSFEEVMSFFMEKWAPIVENLHSSTGGIIVEFLQSVIVAIKELPTNEIIQMLLSKCNTRTSSEQVISIYMPLLIGHLPSEVTVLIEDIKVATVQMGGRRNASCRFLQRGSTENMCGKGNTIVCKGVLQIPRNKDIPKRLLHELDCMCYPHEEISKDSISDPDISNHIQMNVSDVLQANVGGIPNIDTDFREASNTSNVQNTSSSPFLPPRTSTPTNPTIADTTQQPDVQPSSSPPYLPPRESTPTSADTTQQVVSSVNRELQRRAALDLLTVAPVISESPKSKEVCPKDVCKLKKQGRQWIQCDLCKQWFHCSCVGLTKKKADQLMEWKCALCSN